MRAFRQCITALLLAPLLLSGGFAQASTADHTLFEALQGPFASGEEVTRACLSCHSKAASQVMATRHWTWDYINPDTGQRLGKKTMLNGFCIGDRSNEAFCQSCHIGYGWKDASFDFTDESKVDCLACHNTGNYLKLAGLAGHPPLARSETAPGSGKFVEPVDLAAVARQIGATSRRTCGTCHYYGGGGDGVKHGDLDSSLNSPPSELDVHMAADGLDFACSTCHVAEEHRIAGSRINVTASDPRNAATRGQRSERNRSTCQSCHGDKPHQGDLLHAGRLNDHTSVLACQSCHIPTFARGGVPTKMAWDWSTAGKMGPDGKPYQTRNERGQVLYDSRKGSFILGQDVVPDYVWFDGRVTYVQPDTVIDPTSRVPINRFHGVPGAADARIWPVKTFHGRQPYDTEYLTLLVPHTALPNDTAFWYNFDWAKALQAGADASGAPYSGQFDFVDTSMLWPITHMVAPKEQAVDCAQCHTRQQSRLAGVPGIWLTGNNHSPLLDRIGFGLAGVALLGVFAHAALRVSSRRRRSH
ncbi:tetrathionate reductase family octaheme c-type cytochrome [Pseudomonas songnenensis]|uniref:tetrathionate reductase family octaheme c-type cytochrome n=1 Tax=Pseudomonas songnenensis TaxID=1176259 RepID=UPI0028AE7F79|nr:tetrathionate reductase family octaheme c-type cytochrome [Pseudomonas songnenensis]